MSVTQPAPAAESPPAAGVRPATSLLRILVVLALAGVILWQAGVFTPKPTIAMVTSGDTPYWDRVVAGAQSAADVYEVRLKVLRPKTAVEAQTEAIGDLRAEKLAGVAISPINPASQVAMLAEIAAVTPLVTMDSDSPVAKRLCFVGTDNYHAGRLLAERVRAVMPEGGEIAVSLGNPLKENTRLRRQGFIDGLLEREYEPDRPADPFDQPVTGGPYTISATLVDGSDPARATELAATLLRERPNTRCFVGLLGYSAPAILKAVSDAGKQGQVKIVGFDADAQTIAGIEAGHITASILQDQYGIGFQSVRILAENARGAAGGLPMFQRRTLPCEVVDASNVAAVKAQLAAAPAAAAAPPTK